MKLTITILILSSALSYADPLVWNTPIGKIGLPLEATEAIVGYDAVLKQAIGGASIPVYSDPLNIINFHVGAVAPWQSNGPTIEPYLSLGHDLLRDIPQLAAYQSLHFNVFGRYATQQGKAGVGASFSYSFAGKELSTKSTLDRQAVPAPEPEQPPKSLPPPVPHPL